MFFDDIPTHGVYCPGCKERVTVYLMDSLHYGNVRALCEPEEHEFDYTPVDHKAIYHEARRGFL